MAAMGHGRSATNTNMYVMGGGLISRRVDGNIYYEDISNKEKWYFNMQHLCGLLCGR